MTMYIFRGEGGSKKDLIATAKHIAESSTEVAKLAQKLAGECTDKKMRTVYENECNNNIFMKF
jgi:vinculin